MTGAFAQLAELAGALAGQQVEFSPAAAALLDGPESVDRQLADRVQGEDEIMAPYGVYRCAGEGDWVAVAVETDEEWNGLLRAIGRAELARERAYGDAYARWERRAELDELVSAWTASLTPREAAERLQREGVAAAPSERTRG